MASEEMIVNNFDLYNEISVRYREVPNGPQSSTSPRELRIPQKLRKRTLPLDAMKGMIKKFKETRVSQNSPKENAMSNAFWVSVRNNISKRWNTTENDVSKNQSSADSAIRLPNTSILNSNAADITEYFLDVYQTTLY
ncbi:hypothetical protein TNCV_3186301 [Trichonephila clavipes]|nr:hypothetical protein TNCV_3186301 [Trichonephila clavipes]